MEYFIVLVVATTITHYYFKYLLKTHIPVIEVRKRYKRLYNLEYMISGMILIYASPWCFILSADNKKSFF